MDHDHVRYLRRSHPAWRLLASPNAPLVVGFLHEAFIETNTRALAEQDLIAALDDYLFRLRDQNGQSEHQRPAAEYIAEWANEDHGWLRRYYPERGDEPHFDLTPATETAIQWVVGLEHQPEFVGAESRLRNVFELLRELTHGAETDPETRLAELSRRRAEIDAEIERVRAGEVDLMDSTRLRERFQEATRTARALLSDFRQVEQNFRDLDRQVRERIATWEGGRGELLDDIFGEQDAIAESDQGRSFRAFWDFLMSPARQEELTELLDRALKLDPVQQLHPDPSIRRIHYDWLDAGEATQRMVARLSQQLRRYLDDHAWVENRRIMELIRHVEQHALAVREQPPQGKIMALDEPSPSVQLPLERPLFTPPLRQQLNDQGIIEGESDVDPEGLFEQIYIDRDRLRARIRRALNRSASASLAHIVEEHPLEHGLAELVTYFALAADDPNAVIDPSRSEHIEWVDTEGASRRATVPAVVFTHG